MTYSYYKQGGAMRAFALILASALIIALVWFVSYKNGCVTCSKTDTGRPTVSCQGCPDPKTLTDQEPKPSGTDPAEPVPAEPSDPVQPESKKVTFEVVIDGVVKSFEIDLDNLGSYQRTEQSDDGQIKATFINSDTADIRIIIDAPKEKEEEKPETPEPPEPQEETGEEIITEDQTGTSTIEGGTDVGGGIETVTPVPETPETPAQNNQQAALTPFNTLLPPVTLLKGETFGMEGKVLAMGKGCERRDVIVAVVPPEGNCLTLLCDTLCTQKTINAVKAKYPGRTAYTYTIDCEYFVNLRGDSYFELYNCAESVDIQSGMEKPAWLSYETSTVSDDLVNTYVAKNELERFHVKGTDGCLVICENDDVYRYERF